MGNRYVAVSGQSNPAKVDVFDGALQTWHTDNDLPHEDELYLYATASISNVLYIIGLSPYCYSTHIHILFSGGLSLEDETFEGRWTDEGIQCRDRQETNEIRKN